MRKILALALVASFAALVACNKTEEAKPTVDTTVVKLDTAKKDTVKADTAKKDSVKADSAKKAAAKK
jgi:hypothetical protein